MNSRINIGIIGFGKMGQTRAEAFEKVSDVTIARVYEEFPNGPINYETSSSIDDLINDSDIDAICICTPNHLNKSLTIQGLKSGKHVFCEKPPAFTAADVEEIREVEKESGKKLMYGFNHRHHGSILKMKEIIDNEVFGKVLWMRGRYGKSVDETYLDNWRANKEMAGGGILIDQGIHMLDLFLHLGGSFDEVNAMISSLYWNIPDIEDNVFAIMRNKETGLAASLHSTMTQWRHLFSLEVFLEKGYMVLNGLKTSSNSYGEEELSIAKNRSKAPAASFEDEEKIVYKTDKSWFRETELFIDAVRNGTEIRYGSSDDALQLMKLIDEIYSHKKHTKDKLYHKLNTQ